MHLRFIFCLHDDSFFCSFFWADATCRALVSLLPTICPILLCEVDEMRDKQETQWTGRLTRTNSDKKTATKQKGKEKGGTYRTDQKNVNPWAADRHAKEGGTTIANAEQKKKGGGEFPINVQ